jgi:hypothetical protein
MLGLLSHALEPPVPRTALEHKLLLAMRRCGGMLSVLRFIWNATRHHRLAPWRSPYLLWRIETYCGVKMQQIGFLGFWEFLWRERTSLWRFLAWTAEMQRYGRPNGKQP